MARFSTRVGYGTGEGGQSTQGLVKKENNVNVQSVVGYSNLFELSTDYFYINHVVSFP